MPPCKGHTKSRNGCLMCKQRRVKCDETHPVCRNCTAHGSPLPCVYNPVKAPLRNAATGRRSTKASSASASSSSVQDESLDAVSLAGPSTLAGSSSSTSVLEVMELRPPKAVYGQLCTTCGHFHRSGMSQVMQEEYPGGLSGCQLINLTTTELNLNALSSSSSSPSILKDVPPLSVPAFLHSFDIMTPSSLPMTIRQSPQEVFSNLSMFNHFITTTSHTLTLSSHTDSRHIWSQVIPTLSQAHPFLFHAILAVTSAHIGYKYKIANEPQPEKVAEVRRVEERHYVEAMRRLKMVIVEGIDEVNCHATFAAAVVCIIYFVSRRRKQSPFNPVCGPVRRHLDLSWASFLRGTCGALHSLWPMVMRGPVALLVYEFPSTENTTKVLCGNTERMLERLNRLCLDFNILGEGQAGEMKDVRTAMGYYAALYNLRMVWGVLEEYRASFGLGSRSSSRLGADEGDSVELGGGTFDSVYDGSNAQHYHHHHEQEQHQQQHLPEPKDRHFREVLGIGGSAALCAAITQYVLRTPAAFWDALERKSPRALIIYAYYTVCWEGLAYGSASGDDYHLGLDEYEHERRYGRWWTQGRAETDLKGIEEELDECAKDEEERREWGEWIRGAWNVFEGLRSGTWLDDGGGSLGLG